MTQSFFFFPRRPRFFVFKQPLRKMLDVVCDSLIGQGLADLAPLEPILEKKKKKEEELV